MLKPIFLSVGDIPHPLPLYEAVLCVDKNGQHDQ